MKHFDEPDTTEPVTRDLIAPPRWLGLWPSGPYVQAVYEGLVEQYAEPHRRYHTLDHVLACIDEFERLCPETAAVDHDVCRIALWFHDCFYEPRATNNEWRSAVSAANMCRQLGRPEIAEHVKSCVIATKHGGATLTYEAKYVVDADLSILGAELTVFDAYEDGIRFEYKHVPDEAFRAGRATILREFLRRTSIYETDPFRNAYETKARENLRASLERLA